MPLGTCSGIWTGWWTSLHGPPCRESQLCLDGGKCICISCEAQLISYCVFLTGLFTVPVKCLIEPRKSRLIRDPNMEYVAALKEEMINNPTSNVAPLIGVVHLKEDEPFDKKHPEAYVYEVIGGNHSRIALNQILLCDQSNIYRFRTVSVYNSSITDVEANTCH